MINNLLLEDRSAQIVDGFRRLAEEFIDLLFLARIAANLIVNSALQFFLAHFDTGLVADFRENETKANAAFSQLAIFLASLFFRRIFVFEGLAGFLQVVADLCPDIVELGIDQAFWRLRTGTRRRAHPESDA